MREVLPSLKPMRCELCGGVMKLVRQASAPAEGAAVAIYRCEQCQHTVSRPVEENIDR